MEGIRDNSSSERASGDTGSAESAKKDSKKKSSIRVPLGAVGGAEQAGSKPKPEAEKPSRFSEALAELSLKSREAAESKAKKPKDDEPEVPLRPEKPAESEALPAVTTSDQPPEKAMEAAAEKDDDDDDETDKAGTESRKKPGPVIKSEKQPEESESATDQKSLTEQFLDETKEKPELSEMTSVEPESEAEEHYEPLPEYEPKPNELNTGEVIIPLDGDRTIEERVVLLHGPEPAADEGLQEPEVPAETPPPFWRFQPEQQHQARFEAPEPEPDPQRGASSFESATSASEPETPSSGEYTAMPEAGPMQSPNSSEATVSYPVTTAAYYEQNPVAAANAATSVSGPEKVATQQDVEDAIYYATKSGQRRGLITGLFVGGLYEHFKHRRREKKAEKRFKQQSKQLEQTRQDVKFNLQEQARRDAEMQARLATTERRADALRRSQEVGEPALRATVGAERQTGVQAEKTPTERSEKLVIRTSEQKTAENMEQLAVADGHRLETSAWHAIEVDAKTGKAVENPTFQYGQEFHRERAKESMPAEPPASVPAQGSGSVDDLAAAAKIPNASTGGGVLPPPNLPNATTQGEPSNPKDKAKAALLSLTRPKENGNPVQTGPIWPWLVALGVVVILLIVMI